MHRLALTRAETSKKLIVFLLDSLSLFVLYIPLYFGLLYGLFNINNSYIKSVQTRKDIETEHGLVLNFDNSWQEYEAVIKKFYEDYKDVIESYINVGEVHDETYIHAYNVTVLKLPETPNENNFKTNYYRYKIDGEGKYLVHEYGEWIEVSPEEQTSYYKKAMMNLFYYEYRNIPSYLKTFNSDYSLAIDTMLFKESFSRLISFSGSVVILFYILPLIFKHGPTLVERLFGLAKVDSKYGCSVSKWKLFIKPIIMFAIPGVGFYLGGFSNLVIFGLGPLFINFLCLLLTHDNLDFANLILKIDLAVKLDSEIAETKKDIIDTLKNENIEDKNFLNKLSSLDTLDVLGQEEKTNQNDTKKD